MARKQVNKSIAVGPFTVVGVQLSTTELLVTSFIVQAPFANTDFIKIGNATGQIFMIAPGKDLSVNGDNLDNGTTAYTDLSEWYVSSESGIQNAVVLYLERF